MYDNDTLLKSLQEGNEDALDEIVKKNMGLVKSIALRFCSRGIDYEDLVQIGSIGLLRAARSFDFSYGCVFSTYAVPLIIGEIRRFLRDDGIIKVSRALKSSGMNILKKREEFLRIKGREPTVSELSDMCDLSPDEVFAALEASSPIASLNDKMSEDGPSLSDMIADSRSDVDSFCEKVALSDAIKQLTREQQEILTLRYKKDLSQAKTGEILGITQVKVSREEKKILEKLRCLLS